jgi:hypothetical protein
MRKPKSLEGIISHLTEEHGGNVHEKGIVAITSKSGQDVKNVADLNSEREFRSKDEPGQWICWDFREMRLRPTHYTMSAEGLVSWVVEGSADGDGWAEMDRKTDDRAFRWGAATSSIAVSKPAECRFIRITQTGKRQDGRDGLRLTAVEFFGTLSE